MDTNLVEAIQKNLGYQPLEKVDPNAQEIKEANSTPSDQKLSQAAIPAVLAGIMKASDGAEGVNLLTGNASQDILGTIYGESKNDVIKKVADYAGVSQGESTQHMEKIASEALRVIREEVKTADPEKFRSFMNGQRHNILSHLPAVLKMGDVLNEENFDDRTNKMEGPISSFLHKIEDII